MEKDGKIQNRQQTLVEDAHLRIAGEEAKGAAMGDFKHALDATRRGLGKFRIARVRHLRRQIEQSLFAVIEVRRHHEFAGFAQTN